MGVQVAFSYTVWRELYPEFRAVNQIQAQGYFDQATIIQRNDGSGPVTKEAVQLMLLNMLTAHLTALYSQSQGDPSPGNAKDANTPVGRISSATEGSVTAQFDYGQSVGSQMAFFIQTRYGAQWWASTAQYRRAFYVPGRLQAGGLGRVY